MLRELGESLHGNTSIYKYCIRVLRRLFLLSGSNCYSGWVLCKQAHPQLYCAVFLLPFCHSQLRYCGDPPGGIPCGGRSGFSANLLFCGKSVCVYPILPVPHVPGISAESGGGSPDCPDQAVFYWNGKDPPAHGDSAAVPFPGIWNHLLL